MTEPREGSWTGKPLPSRRLIYAGALGVVMTFSVIAQIVTLLSRHGKGFPDWMSLILPVGFIAVILIALFNEFRTLRFTYSDAARTERPEGLEEYPSEVGFFVSDDEIGGDRVVIYFDRGLIGFVGGRASFLLAASDFSRPAGPVLTEFHVAHRALKLRANDGKAAVSIRPLIGHGRAYRKRLRRFLDDSLPTEGPRQWPPLKPFASPPTPSSFRSEETAALKAAPHEEGTS